MDKSEKFWDKSASGYDKEEMKDREVRRKILEKTKKYLRKQDSVLDYGCATGILANEIAGEVDMVYGIDISSKMVQIAQRKAGERNIRNVHYTQSTIFDERHRIGAYDVILGVYLLHLLEDMPKALGRMHELLKPGGLFISLTPCLGKKSFAGIALMLINKLGLIPDLKLYDVSDLKSTISNTGFKIIETECIQQSGRQYFIVAEKS
jgi:2-polyprenyl-3-methyl-5-hydroxy-6-metoxy-1,4-benzoquinol methylase